MTNPNTEKSSDPFQHKSGTFLKWVSTAEDARLSPKLDLADLRARGAGRGVVALSDIAKDEELFAVPRTLVLDVTNSDLTQRVQDLIEQFGPWNSLVVVIIYEYLRKDASPWFPYFDVLPTTFNTLIFWSAAELAELRGSAVVDKIGKEDAEAGWKLTIVPFMRKYPSLFPVEKELVSSPVAEKQAERELVKLAHMAGSLIMAYAFDLGKDDESNEGDEDGFIEDDDDDPAKGMVPMADMLNADADRNNARLFHEEDFLVMKATQSISAGDEIFNDYGPLPRSDLLRMYGYVTDNYARYDVVEVASELIERVARSSGQTRTEKVKQATTALKELELLEDGYAIPRPAQEVKLKDAVPAELHMLICALSCEGESGADPRVSKYFSGNRQGWGFSEAALLSTVLTKRLTDYQTTVREDEIILSQIEHGESNQIPCGVSRNRYEMAIQVRKGEKEILHHVLNLIQDFVSTRTSEISAAPVKRKRSKDNSSPRKGRKTPRT